MYLKIKNNYYKVSGNLSLKLISLIANIESRVPHSPIVLDNSDTYSIKVCYASGFIHEHQLKLTIKEVIKKVFKDKVSDINIHFEPRNILKISLVIGKFIPVSIEGIIDINNKYNTIIYKFNNIKAMHLPVNSLLEAIKSFPGISLSFKTEDGVAIVENDAARIFIKEFIPNINLEFTLSDAYFTEDGFNIELKGINITDLEKPFSFNLPESYVYLLGDTLKINNIEISDAKIAIFKEDGKTFALNIFDYQNLIRHSFIQYTDTNEIIVKVLEQMNVIKVENSN